MTEGYSGTPLAKKLGLKAGFTAFFHQQPLHYFDLFTDFPSELKVVDALAEGQALDFIHLFCRSMEELKTNVGKYKEALKKDGLLWISWPKGKSSIPTDLNRDLIRDYVLGTGLVDVKVAAIDKDWSGLKFVYRVKDR